MPASAVGGSVTSGRAAWTAIGVRRREPRALAVARATRHAASTRSADHETEDRDHADPTQDQRVELDAAIQLGGPRDSDRHERRHGDRDDEREHGRDAAREQSPVPRRASTARGVPCPARAGRCRHAPPRRPGAAGPARRRTTARAPRAARRGGARWPRPRIAVSTFGCCSCRLTMKPAGAPCGQPLDALGERVQEIRAASAART